MAPIWRHGGASVAAARGHRLKALVVKEALQLRRDPRSLTLLILMPVVLLLLFGYGIDYNVHNVRAELVGGSAPAVRAELESGDAFAVAPAPARDERQARADLRAGRAVLAVVVDGSGRPVKALLDASDQLTASAALRNLRALAATPSARSVPVELLYNPKLRTINFLMPGLIGLIMAYVGMIASALGIVRERERGTLEQLMVTPLTKLELMFGKIVPYLAIAILDVVLIVALGIVLFDVPLRGSAVLLLCLSVMFLASTLALGLLISTIARDQRQAMQIAVVFLLPMVLLSGEFFPLESIPWGIRWISYLMPLTYFMPITRGIFLKGLGLGDLWWQSLMLAVMTAVFVALAVSRFRKSLD
jgi:ABC-2 type transport system permease protein